MRIRIVKYVCADGVERGILEYRNHWWEKWEPLHQDGKLVYVSYMGTKPYKSLQEECFDMLELNEEQRKVREQMFRYILDAKRYMLVQELVASIISAMMLKMMRVWRHLEIWRNSYARKDFFGYDRYYISKRGKFESL